jgi:hypothetical protein
MDPRTSAPDNMTSQKTVVDDIEDLGDFVPVWKESPRRNSDDDDDNYAPAKTAMRHVDKFATIEEGRDSDFDYDKNPDIESAIKTERTLHKWRVD